MEAFYGLLCIIIPAVLMFWVGYTIGRRGRPRLRLEFQGEQVDKGEVDKGQ